MRSFHNPSKQSSIEIQIPKVCFIKSSNALECIKIWINDYSVNAKQNIILLFSYLLLMMSKGWYFTLHSLFLQILTLIFCKMILLFALSEKDVLWGHISKIRNAVNLWPFHHFWKWKAILLFEPCPLLIGKREVLLPSINSWWKTGAFNWLFHRRLAFLSDKGFGRSVKRYCLAVVSWRSFE